MKYFLGLFFVVHFFVQVTCCIDKQAKIYVAGHTGLVGSALTRALEKAGYTTIVTRTSKELDLRNQAAVERFFEEEQPEYVIVVAAKVGGIMANSTYPQDFLYDNAMITLNIINAAHTSKVKKLLYLGSSCMYPKDFEDPIKEEDLLTGPLEPTNEGYALAKIVGVKLCQACKKQSGDNFISCTPCNLYGPRDNFNLASSHVIPAIIKKMAQAKKSNTPSVEVWGTGMAKREFLHVDDCAAACLFLLENYDGNTAVNVGFGQDITIKELAYLIKKLVGYEGEIIFNSNYPDGMKRKLLDIGYIKTLGWQPSIQLEDGIKDMIAWYYQNNPQDK